MVISKGAELILIKHAFISMAIYRSSMYTLCINTNKFVKTGSVHVLYLVRKEQFTCVIPLSRLHMHRKKSKYPPELSRSGR
jgi:hypothetical protein